MAYAITPSIVPGLDYVGPKPYDDVNSPGPTPALGTKVVGSDGRDYIWVQASAAIATAGTEVIITEPAFTVAAGAGGFDTLADGVQDGDYLWVVRDTL